MYFRKNSTQHALIRYYTHTGGRGAKRRGAKIFRQFKTKNEKNIFIKMVYLIKDNFWWKSSFDQSHFWSKSSFDQSHILPVMTRITKWSIWTFVHVHFDHKIILIIRSFWSYHHFGLEIILTSFDNFGHKILFWRATITSEKMCYFLP